MRYAVLVFAASHHQSGNSGNVALGAAFFIGVGLIFRGLRKRLRGRPGHRSSGAHGRAGARRSPGNVTSGIAVAGLRIGWRVLRSAATNRPDRGNADPGRVTEAMRKARREGTNAKFVAEHGYAQRAGAAGFFERLREAPSELRHLVWLNRDQRDLRPRPFSTAGDGRGENVHGGGPARGDQDPPGRSAQPTPPDQPTASGSPTPTTTPGGTMPAQPANLGIYAAGDHVAGQQFGSLESLERFFKPTFQGCQQLTSLYKAVAAGLDDQLNIDKHATQHLASAATLQTGLAGHVAAVANAVTKILQMTPAEAAELNMRIDRKALDGEILSPRTPALFEQIGQLSQTKWEDPKAGHAFVKALYDAGVQMHDMWSRLHERLTWLRLPRMVLDPLEKVIAAQRDVNRALADADHAYEELMRSTHRYLAERRMRTPTSPS